ncbi:hypothetical protein BDN72DRAFT_791727 [Pluteus cervinus]|uniref:Uncharacterized protein n=1 Tax=Pluteus cervinus TaxID=181527 RepID=A0ACD3B480_9AGAR|nr:hypothetical protein BDN72DRAFT_791727 [Pluteus cervinus]
MSNAQYPQELLSAICAQVYSASLPPKIPSLDPLVTSQCGIPTALPSSVPPAYWPEPVSRRTLANLCMVSHAWYEAAKPWLWYKLEVRLPRSWLSFVEEIAWNYEEETVDSIMTRTIQAATDAVMATVPPGSERDPEMLRESILNKLTEPDLSIPPELLSPAASRDPSPRRIRPKSKSPARWKLLRSISDAIQDVLDRREPGVYVPTPVDPRPGRFVRHLDFNHFRTIGMRRSIEEGVNSRFVTGDRVQAVLKEMPNLTTFGATEYMDGALTLSVLKELFLRGAPSRIRGRPSRGRGVTFAEVDEEDDRERRRECLDLEAVDLTGCVSAVFVNALTEFVNTYLLASVESESGGEEENSRSRHVRHTFDEPLSFPGLQRLGMRGVKSILPRILTPFILAFPSLTHLDLSGTRITSDALYSLGESATVTLQSLAIGRCTRLSGQSLRDFLVYSPVTAQLKELSLYGDLTFPSPLSEDDLHDILTLAPSFVNGDLVYLDLSSAPLTSEMLVDDFPPQPRLRSLGLSHIPDLDLKAIAEFVKAKASHVEVLTLIGTSAQLSCGLRAGAANGDGAPRGSVRQSSIALQTQLIRPLCTPPFSFSLSSPSSPLASPPSRLRVIELSPVMLGGLGAGAGSWKIIRSKGGRGWYVDTASGWVAKEGGSILRRDLEPDHPLRREMERLSEANGNVSSGTGWHARKMEVLHGYGMLGREDGLYGAVSFAYQG